MSRYKSPIKRSCNKCKHFRVLGGKFGVCDEGEHPSEQSECVFFSRLLKKLSLLFLFVLFGCSPRVITVEKVHTVYEHTTDTLEIKDTIFNQSNTIIREARPEDSLLLSQYGIRLRDNERMLLFLQSQLEQEKRQKKEVIHDTVIERDTIPQVVELEKSLSWWERQKQDFGGFVLFVLFCILVYLLFTKIKKQ